MSFDQFIALIVKSNPTLADLAWAVVFVEGASEDQLRTAMTRPRNNPIFASLIRLALNEKITTRNAKEALEVIRLEYVRYGDGSAMQSGSGMPGEMLATSP
jgi:hypothetical protein